MIAHILELCLILSVVYVWLKCYIMIWLEDNIKSGTPPAPIKHAPAGTEGKARFEHTLCSFKIIEEGTKYPANTRMASNMFKLDLKLTQGADSDVFITLGWIVRSRGPRSLNSNLSICIGTTTKCNSTGIPERSRLFEDEDLNYNRSKKFSLLLTSDCFGIFFITCLRTDSL